MSISNYPTTQFLEEDVSTVVDTAASSIPGFVIRAQRGPINKPTLISNEKDLIEIFGEPFNGTISAGVTFNNLKDWFSVANFFSYSNGAYVIRAEISGGAASKNAAIQAGAAAATVDNIRVFDGTDYETVSGFTADRLGIFAKNPGFWGNNIAVALYVAQADDIIANKGGSNSSWNTYKGLNADFQNFDNFPISGEVALIVYFNDVIVEKWILSLSPTGKAFDGSNNFIEDVLKAQSKYISAYINGSVSALASFNKISLANGFIASGNLSDGDVTNSMDLYSNEDEIEINYITDGGFNTKVVQEKVASIAASRKDCFGIIGARTEDIVNKTNAAASASVIAYRKTLSISGNTSTYIGFFGNVKKMYNKYSDKYFWISCSSDVTGLMALTDSLYFPWYATAGSTRGVLKNVSAIGFNPDDIYIGQMYQNNINTIKFEPGVGYIINGNRTLQSKPSAFRDINVRKLFTYCEQNILGTAKYYMFEFNDDITRSNLYSSVNNFMSTIKSNRGVYDYKVICDRTNNTASVIDNNELYLDVLIKASRAIQNITVRFVATRTDAKFDEL